MIAFPIQILKEHAPKPEMGKPCNNCGLCCRLQACIVSRMFLKSDQAPCIALEVHDGKFLCGMLVRPEHYFPQLSQMGQEVRADVIKSIAAVLDVGAGCGMDDRAIAIEVEVDQEDAA